MTSPKAAEAQAATGTARHAEPKVGGHGLGILGWLALLCLLATITLAGYVIFHSYRFSLNTDGAVEDILAKFAIEEGRLIPHNWIYANGDLWILGPRLFLIIAFPFMGFSYRLHATATWLAYLYLLLAVFGTCRGVISQRPRAALFASLLAAGCLSTLNFEFVIGQGAYSLYAALALALFGLSARGFEQLKSTRSLTTSALVCIVAFLVCISNATRGAITVIAPLLIGWMAATVVFVQSREHYKRHLCNAIPLSVLIGAGAGTVLFTYWLLPSVVNSSGAASSQLASIPEAVHHITMLPSAWFTYFQIHGRWEWLSLSLRILQTFVWIFSIALLLAPLHVVIARRHYSISLQVFAWITLACYAITFSALVLSRNLFDGPASLRYATFAIYASICVLAAQCDKALEWRPYVPRILVVLLCLIPLASIAAWREEWTPGGVTYAQRMALISSLERRNIHAALATYWNSEVLTVLSGDKIEMLPVDLDTNGLRRHAQNGPRTATLDVGGRQAIALTVSEASAMTWKKLDYQLGEPIQRYESGPFRVAIYDKALIDRLYGSDATADISVAAGKLMVELSPTRLAPCRSTRVCHYWIDVTNIGQTTLATAGTKPFRLGIHAIDGEGNIMKWDAGRIDFPLPILPSETERIEAILSPLTDPRIASYQLCLLQEQAAWHCDRTKSRTAPQISR